MIAPGKSNKWIWGGMIVRHTIFYYKYYLLGNRAYDFLGELNTLPMKISNPNTARFIKLKKRKTICKQPYVGIKQTVLEYLGSNFKPYIKYFISIICQNHVFNLTVIPDLLIQPHIGTFRFLLQTASPILYKLQNLPTALSFPGSQALKTWACKTPFLWIHLCKEEEETVQALNNISLQYHGECCIRLI